MANPRVALESAAKNAAYWQIGVAVVIFVCCVATTPPAWSQGKKQMAQSPSSPLVGDIRKVPVGYKGTDPAIIVESFLEAPSKKGEFETTAQYQKRVGASNGASMRGKVVTIPIGVHQGNSKYDADSEILNVSLPAIGRVADGGPYVPLKISKRNSSSYVASNAFGAQVEVSSQGTEGIGYFTPGAVTRPISLSVQLPLQTAKATRDSLELMITGRLGGQLREAGWRIAATRQMPSEQSLKMTLIPLTPISAHLVDKRTGTVLTTQLY